jgi:predicted kinase
MLSFSALCAQLETSPSIDKVKEKIITSLSQTLIGHSQPQPVLILIGGYVGSGKTTLSSALQKKYHATVFSLNAIRQAMLDEGIDIRSNKEEERNILFELYPRLLAPCIANHQHIIIDANAHRQGIQDALRFLEKHPGGKAYRVVKIHLTLPQEELYQRVRSRIQEAHLHQGTEKDLDRELHTEAKAIHSEDYDLTIDTKNTSLEDEIKRVDDFLKPYFENQSVT